MAAVKIFWCAGLQNCLDFCFELSLHDLSLFFFYEYLRSNIESIVHLKSYYAKVFTTVFSNKEKWIIKWHFYS